MTYAWVGIDNGISGSIAIYTFDDGMKLFKTPVKKELSYTKKKQYITRIDAVELRSLLYPLVNQEVKCFIERPFTGKFFKAVASAMRALEATLIVLEELGISYEYIDSKEWQKSLLPKGMKKGETKKPQ